MTASKSPISVFCMRIRFRRKRAIGFVVTMKSVISTDDWFPAASTASTLSVCGAVLFQEIKKEKTPSFPLSAISSAFHLLASSPSK